MGGAGYLQFAAALLFVMTLIGMLALLARRLGLGYGTRGGCRSRRLGIAEVLPLDGRRKLVLVRRDDVEHLVILGATSETVVEANIVIPAHTADAAVSGGTTAAADRPPKGSFARFLAAGREGC